ncbi:hypothetical protein CPIN17260_1101 [Campylobacter pinnipediorum subsp. pinnipediorum]|uniref:Uncharacterized protein n=1 Tax=Campylobacter pinnipediorum subsp. pinnipediorum TaxID=1660067 RepID=A0AAX0L9Z5_9BACT|nr:hypothetical protein [Campylobacter pinnipediorum]AQW81390.1 hypothetical protein CPIN17260_1101 [Campylobacter pinnipediorum subsp. pinnipediorum]OPA77355.1 hypothetical protein BFG04_04475 [Campylobacter pinnipediorum subsp. pinnipediorum]
MSETLKAFIFGFKNAFRFVNTSEISTLNERGELSEKIFNARIQEFKKHYAEQKNTEKTK